MEKGGLGEGKHGRTHQSLDSTNGRFLENCTLKQCCARKLVIPFRVDIVRRSSDIHQAPDREYHEEQRELMRRQCVVHCGREPRHCLHLRVRVKLFKDERVELVERNRIVPVVCGHAKKNNPIEIKSVTRVYRLAWWGM